jgi:hypothetical protein
MRRASMIPALVLLALTGCSRPGAHVWTTRHEAPPDVCTGKGTEIRYYSSESPPETSALPTQMDRDCWGIVHAGLRRSGSFADPASTAASDLAPVEVQAVYFVASKRGKVESVHKQLVGDLLRPVEYIALPAQEAKRLWREAEIQSTFDTSWLFRARTAETGRGWSATLFIEYAGELPYVRRGSLCDALVSETPAGDGRAQVNVLLSANSENHLREIAELNVPVDPDHWYLKLIDDPRPDEPIAAVLVHAAPCMDGALAVSR